MYVQYMHCTYSTCTVLYIKSFGINLLALEGRQENRQVAAGVRGVLPSVSTKFTSGRRIENGA